MKPYEIAMWNNWTSTAQLLKRTELKSAVACLMTFHVRAMGGFGWTEFLRLEYVGAYWSCG